MAGLLDILNRNPGLLSPLPSQSALGPGIGQAKALLAQPAPVQAAPAVAPRARVNPLRVAFSTLFDGTNPFTAYDEEKMRPQMQARAAENLAFERSARQNLLGMFGGGPAAAPVGIMRTPDTPAFTGAPMAGASAMGSPGRLPSIQTAAPALAAAQLAGIDGVGGLRELITAAQPDIQIGPDGQAYDANDPANLTRRFGKNENINGFVTDVNDPANRNLYRPDLAEGQEPVYDAQGRVVGVRNINGSVQSEAERVRAVNNAQNASEASYAGAISGAKAAGEAPYAIERVAGPDGGVITTSRASLLNSGPIQGQTEAQRAQAIIEAQGQGEAANLAAQRVRQAPERIQRYTEALSLIPKAITGTAADTRLAAARALAFTGNQDAKDAVAATEIYQNLINRDVGAIVKDMVGAANISNSDRELAQSIAGGNINITPAALTRIVNYELNRQRGYLAQGTRGQSAAQPTAAEARAILRSRGVPGY